MAQRLKAGVIGLGLIGRQYVDQLSNHPRVDVKAVADERAEAAEQVGSALDVPHYTDTNDMLAGGPLDLVAVATPDPHHLHPVMAALRAGTPFLVLEKPMATRAEDARTMLEEAEKRGARIFVNYANRGFAMDRATHYAVSSGLLGEVVYGDSHLDDNILVPTSLWGKRTSEWVAGSSVAHFLMSHQVDLFRWLLDPQEVREVYAVDQRRVLSGTPDLYDAYLTFSGGARVRVKAEWIRHIDSLVEFEVILSGSGGSLAYTKRPGFGQRAGWRVNVGGTLSLADLLGHRDELRRRGIPVRALVHDLPALAEMGRAADAPPTPCLEALDPAPDPWHLVSCFIDAILEDTLRPSSWRQYGDLPTGADGLLQTEVVAAVVASAATGKPVRLPV